MRRNPAVRITVVALATAFATTAAFAAEEPEEPGHGGPSFVDPTAKLEKRQHIFLGQLDYVAPFAYLKAAGPNKYISVGDETNIQDSVFIDAGNGPVRLGDQVILAHNATVKTENGPRAHVGEEGTCPDPDAEGPETAPSSCPSFVGFNAEVDGAFVQKDAMVQPLARVARGVTIPSGLKVLPGKNIERQSDVAAKTAPVTAGDRVFMAGVIEVNTEFAVAYTELQAENPTNVMGINFDPDTTFNPGRQLPDFQGRDDRDPSYARNYDSGKARLIGEVKFEQSKGSFTERSGVKNSLRADEGYPFEVGTIESMKDNVTFHALEHSAIRTGPRGVFGVHTVVHGGPEDFPGSPTNTTVMGAEVELKDWAVLFNSRIGERSRIGYKSLVQASDLPPGTQVPDRTVILNNVVFGRVEW